jgi:hypothetical protein
MSRVTDGSMSRLQRVRVCEISFDLTCKDALEDTFYYPFIQKLSHLIPPSCEFIYSPSPRNAYIIPILQKMCILVGDVSRLKYTPSCDDTYLLFLAVQHFIKGIRSRLFWYYEPCERVCSVNHVKDVYAHLSPSAQTLFYWLAVFQESSPI